MKSDDSTREAPALALPMTLAQGYEVIQTQAGCVDLLLQKLTDYEAQLAVLQERLKLNSRNSSEPP